MQQKFWQILIMHTYNAGHLAYSIKVRVIFLFVFKFVKCFITWPLCACVYICLLFLWDLPTVIDVTSTLQSMCEIVSQSRDQRKTEEKKYNFHFEHARKESKNNDNKKNRRFHFVSWLLFPLLVRLFSSIWFWIFAFSLSSSVLCVCESHQVSSILYGNHFDVILFV